MKPNFRTIIALTGLLGATLANAVTASAQTTKETVVYSTGLPELSPNEIADLRRDALNGSASAAKTLALRSGLGAGDVKGEVYWYSIAVEDGDKLSRCSLANSLIAADDEAGTTRAHYWFNQIESDGSADEVKCAKAGIDEAAIVEAWRKRHPK